MNTKFMIAASLFSTLAVIAGAQSGSKASGHAHGGGSGSQQMMDSMKDGMSKMQSMKMTGDTDRDFAMMMRMHHQQALDMAQVELNSGKDEKMKAMARKIVEEQKKEIKQLDDWLASKK